METLNHLQDTENDLSCALSLNTIFRFFHFTQATIFKLCFE